MRATFATAVLLATLISTVGPHATFVHAEDDLFSEISMAEVFEEVAVSTDKTTAIQGKKTKQNTNTASLIKTPSIKTPSIKTPSTKTPSTKAKVIKKVESNTKAVPKLSLQGTWTASISDVEAFAINITKDRKFRLVHIKNGQSQISRGTASKTAALLTLTGDDQTKLTGTVTQSSNQAFQWDITKGDGSIALSLKFQKAN